MNIIHYTNPEDEADNGCSLTWELVVVALECCLWGEEWCDSVSGLTMTALGDAGEGTKTASTPQLHKYI